MKKLISLCLVVFISINLFGCEAKEKIKKNYANLDKPFQFVFDAFDTRCSISIYGIEDQQLCQTYGNDMSTLVHKFDDIFSKTKEGSDIYRINHRTGDSVCVNEDVATLLSLGKDFYSWTGGKFDISSGTLIDLWDIKNRRTVPTIDEVNEARKHCGNFNFECREVENPVDDKTVEIVFSGDKETKYDLGGLVKGFCCDRLSAMLNENKEIKACIINLGGNVCVKGKVEGRSDGAFNVGIFKPFSNAEVIDSVKVIDKNVITSGNYQRYFKIDGDDTIYHHIIDPTTGYPTNNGLNSVTIVSNNGLLGDFMSTSCMLLGVDNSRGFINNCADNFKDKNIQGIFILSDNSIVKYPKKVKFK